MADAFIFGAALYCSDCAARIKIDRKEYEPANPDDESSYDSDIWPKGPYRNGGGEADSPQNCDSCGAFLENPLTPDGDAWLRERAAPYVAPDSSWDETAKRAYDAGEGSLSEWITYYLAWGQ